jgi:hypothetical protein
LVNRLAYRTDSLFSLGRSRTLGPLKVPGGTVQREVFSEAFPNLVRELQSGTYLAPTRLKR